MIVDLLDELIKGNITEAEAYRIMDELYEKLHEGKTTKLSQETYGMNRYESTARATGLGLSNLANFRKDGWPVFCSTCGQPLDYKIGRWMVSHPSDRKYNSPLRHLLCECSHSFKKSIIKDRRLEGLSNKCVICKRKIGYSELGWCIDFKKNLFHDRCNISVEFQERLKKNGYESKHIELVLLKREPNKMKIDLLEEIIQGRMNEEEAQKYWKNLIKEYHQFIRVLERPSWETIGMNRYEFEAIPAGFSTIAHWRQKGWPTSCGICKERLNYKLGYWCISKNNMSEEPTLQHITCGEIHPFKTLKIKVLRRQKRVLHCKFCNEVIDYEKNDWNYYKTHDTYHYRCC